MQAAELGRSTPSPTPAQYAPRVVHFLFNVAGETREEAGARMRAGRWDVAADERHRDALAAGDLALVYLAAPARELIGRAELGSAADGSGVSLARVEEWDPPVPMEAVLSRLDRSGGARADFDAGLVRNTADEYDTAGAVAAELARS